MHVSYYREPAIQNNDFASDRVALQLNCACRHTFGKGMWASSVRRDCYLFYVRQGSVRLLAPIQTVMQAGDLIVFEPNRPFAYTNQNKSSCHYAAHFTGREALSLLERCHIPMGRVCSVGHPERIDMAFQEIFQTFLCRDHLFDLDSAGRLTSLLVTVGRILDQSRPAYESPLRIQRSLDHLHRHFSEPMTVQALADMEHLSESRYRVLFGTLVGQSPHDYLTGLRLRTACELLAQSDQGIGEIARTVGFPDGRYFSRLFRKHYGMTPTAWRANAKDTV